MTTVLDAYGFPIEDFTKHYALESLPSPHVNGCSTCVFQSENCMHRTHITEDAKFKKQVGECATFLNSYYVKL